MYPSALTEVPLMHLVRHGEALHNVNRHYPHRDPPLTEAGQDATKKIELPVEPDLILISPMTRTIQTAANMFPFLLGGGPFPTPVQIWSDLREANDAVCNKGLRRTDLQSDFPQFDFSDCHDDWDYAPHTVADATARAERVRQRLKELSHAYKHIAIITHRGFLAYLAKGRRFNLCETRSYRFAVGEEAQDPRVRRGLNCDTLEVQDYGPTLMVLATNSS